MSAKEFIERQCVLVCLLSAVARVATAQFTPRDTVALVNAIAVRIRTQVATGAIRPPYVIEEYRPLEPPTTVLAARVSAAVRALDSSLVATAPTRNTPRIQIGALTLVPGDTAATTLFVAWCSGTPSIHSWHTASLAFRPAGGGWIFVERNVGGSGGGSTGCPW